MTVFAIYAILQYGKKTILTFSFSFPTFFCDINFARLIFSNFLRGIIGLVNLEILLKLICNGKINVSEKIPANITEGIMRELLKEVHKYKITMSGDRWTTRVPDPTKPKGLRQVKKKSRADLYKYLLEFYAIAETSKNITFNSNISNSKFANFR